MVIKELYSLVTLFMLHVTADETQPKIMNHCYDVLLFVFLCYT